VPLGPGNVAAVGDKVQGFPTCASADEAVKTPIAHKYSGNDARSAFLHNALIPASFTRGGLDDSGNEQFRPKIFIFSSRMS
jgi:hypothetical protein